MSQPSNRAIRLLLTGGGTGGHLFPAIATAQEFQRRYSDTEVLFIGTERKMDTESLGYYGFSGRAIRSSGIKGKKLMQLLKAFGNLPLGYFQALSVLRDFKPDVVLGVGGYVTGPVIAAARTLRIPSVIHEQNSVPGLANRKLARLVNRICLSLPGSETGFSREKVVFTGNPVRENILKLAIEKSELQGSVTMLILGGSQGAHRLNTLVPEACGHLQSTEKIKVIHQTGLKDVVRVQQGYDALGLEARVEPFFQDMAEVYAQADLVVSRAGATTLSELAVLGIPVILVPYPYAADNHQEKNGEYYVGGGGALQFREAELDAVTLAESLDELLQKKERRRKMGAAMKGLAFPDAAERIVDVCMNLIRRDENV